MKRLPFYDTVIRAVKKISGNWMADKFHVDADLVRPSCGKLKAQEGEICVLFICHADVMGDGRLAVLKVHGAL